MSSDATTLAHYGIAVKPSAGLREYTTFQLGGPCRVLLDCQTPDQLERSVRYCLDKRQDFIVIGGGSNLLISDQGVDRVVIRYLSPTPFVRREKDDLIVSGSTVLDDLAHYAAKEGLEGLSCINGIPGTVAGALVGNAGAFGKQIGDVLVSVDLLTRNGTRCSARQGDLNFTYRHSRLKESDDVIVEARLGLRPADPASLLVERDEILKVRRDKHPDLKINPCAGSFFRNIEPTSKAERRQAAGWFLEQAGAKDLSVGGARIFEKHANIIVKSDGCTPQDVFDLSLKMAAAVKEKFGLDLVREVRLVGEFQNRPAGVKELIW